jgi:hypothetical protein
MIRFTVKGNFDRTFKFLKKMEDFDVAKIPIDPPHHITLGIAVNSLKSASPAARKFIDVAVETLRS